MSRHSIFLAGLAAAAVAVAAPVALAGPDHGAADRPPAHSTAAKAKAERAAAAAARAERLRGKRGTVAVQVRACVISDAIQTGAPDALQTTVGLRVLAGNAHARRAGLLRGTEFTVKLDGTIVRLVGKARKQEGTRVRLPRIGTFENLDRGDVVTVRTRVARTAKRQPVAQWDTFGTWRSAVDHGPVRPRVCPDTAPAPAPAT